VGESSLTVNLKVESFYEDNAMSRSFVHRINTWQVEVQAVFIKRKQISKRLEQKAAFLVYFAAAIETDH
jgi:hypothetical protein